MSKTYALMGMGGSFDHFHAGHQHFLTQAAMLADRLVIGVTTDDLIQRKLFPESLETYQTRYQSVADFCQKNQIAAELVPLTDPYGPTLEGSLVQALWVSTETKPGAVLINRVRSQRGLSALPIHECAMVLDQMGTELHSDRIRAGLIDRAGQTWLPPLEHDLVISTQSRQKLAVAQGPIYTESSLPVPVIPMTVVGDSSLETCLKHAWPFRLGIFDQRRARQAVTSTIIDHLQPEMTISNPAGIISVEMVAAIQTCLSQGQKLLKVSGEEDLAAVVLGLVLPLNHTILYGQPNEGLVLVTVTEELKSHLRNLLS